MPILVTTLLGALGGAAAKFALSMVSSWASAEFVEWVFFWGAKNLVKHTDTQHDDEWLAEIEKLYNAKKNSALPLP